MVIMQTPNGRITYRLRSCKTGLRPVSRCASRDLLTMLQAGWRIVDATTTRERRHLGSTQCAALVVSPAHTALSDRESTAA